MNRGPADVFVVAALHWFFIGGQLFSDGAGVDAEVGTCLTVGVVLHGAAAVVAEAVEVSFEEHTNAHAGQGDSGVIKRDVIGNMDGCCTRDRIDGIVIDYKAIAASALQFY